MDSRLLSAEAGWLGGETLECPVRVLLTGEAAVWQPDPASIPPDAQPCHVDGVLLPGLVDHHVHAELVDLTPLLASGVCEVHDLGASAELIFPLVAASRQSVTLPLVRSTGPFLTAPGGYPTDRSWASAGMCRIVRTPDAASSVVRDLVTQGANAIKIALHAEAGPTLSDAVLAAVVTATHAASLPVIAHTEGAGQAERGLAAGVDTLAHTPFTHRLDDHLVARFAARTTWVSTVDIHGWGRDTTSRRIALDNLRRFHAAGGRVRYGTDLGNGPLPLGVNERELAALAEAGLSPGQLLRSLARSRRDVVAAPGDPLRDASVLTRARVVSRAGPSMSPPGPAAHQ